jgi:uncharacterized protein (TIGR03435 family)
MINRAARIPRSILLVAAGWMAIVAPAALAQADAATGGSPSPSAIPAGKPLRFQASTIRENTSPVTINRFVFTPEGIKIDNAPLLLILQAAYGMFNAPDDVFPGLPDWAKTEKFNLAAVVDENDKDAFQQLDMAHRQLMVQALLAERFKLKAHREVRELPVYALVVAKGGPKLQESKLAGTPDLGSSIDRVGGEISAHNVDLSQLVPGLTQIVGHTVQDKTGLTGKYDFVLSWDPDDHSTGSPPQASIFKAVEDQLGLKLEPAKGNVDCLVIDHVDKPAID